MRRWLGVGAGTAAAVAFAASLLAVLSGPDDVVGLPARTLRSDGVAVVTNPNLVSRVGPVVELTARRAGGASGTDLVLALGHTEDVRSYLGSAPHEVVVQLLPELGGVRTDTVEGTGSLAGRPVGQDFWVLERHAPDEVSVRWPTTDGVWSWALLNADGSPGVEAEVSLGVEVPGLFGWSLGVLLLDLLAVAGVVATPRVLAARRRSATGGRRASRPAAAVTAAAPVAVPTGRPADTVVIGRDPLAGASSDTVVVERDPLTDPWRPG